MKRPVFRQLERLADEEPELRLRRREGRQSPSYRMPLDELLREDGRVKRGSDDADAQS